LTPGARGTAARRAVLLAVAVLGAALLAWRLGRDGGGAPARPPNATAGADSFTIWVVGGSTALGEPYAPRADLGRIAAHLLGGDVNGRPIRVVNLGGAGKAAVAVVDDARRVARAVRAPESAVAFLYVGNNEFLGFDRRHDLRRRERALFDVPSVSQSEREDVFERYRESLQRIAAALQDAGIAVVAAATAVNLADWEPNRSVLADTAHAATVRALLAEGERLAAAGDAGGALADFRRVLAIEPGFALASKRAGDCWRALGERDSARACYQRAVDCDGNPYRELSAQNAILRQVCAARAIPVVDAPALLAAASPDGLTGDGVFWDNCHPTLSGYLAIARGFAATVQARFGVRRPLRDATVADLEAAFQIDAAFRRQVLHGRGQYCYAAATLVYAPGPRLRRARRYLEAAVGMGPEDAGITCSLAVLTALDGDARASLELWRRAWRLDPVETRARAENRYVQQIMAQRGVGDLLGQLRLGR